MLEGEGGLYRLVGNTDRYSVVVIREGSSTFNL